MCVHPGKLSVWECESCVQPLMGNLVLCFSVVFGAVSLRASVCMFVCLSTMPTCAGPPEIRVPYLFFPALLTQLTVVEWDPAISHLSTAAILGGETAN